ncbi:MAG: hypothetical protein J7497_10970 [Chitinophagaceae bacterium]|nr:hypothetical protein [Chitinophagaceae bacterium]
MSENRYTHTKLKRKPYYWFRSIGPNGPIKKLVIYRSITKYPVSIFNLSFGDWIGLPYVIDDTVKTNNNDTRKILATVADTVFDFIHYYPDALIFAEGSTHSRTRLYQMGIAAFYQKIITDFDIFGYVNDQWEIFKKGINYEAFLIRKK